MPRVCHHITVIQEVGRKVTTVSEVHTAVGPVSIIVISGAAIDSAGGCNCNRTALEVGAAIRQLWGPGKVS